MFGTREGDVFIFFCANTACCLFFCSSVSIQDTVVAHSGPAWQAQSFKGRCGTALERGGKRRTSEHLLGRICNSAGPAISNYSLDGQDPGADARNVSTRCASATTLGAFFSSAIVRRALEGSCRCRCRVRVPAATGTLDDLPSANEAELSSYGGGSEQTARGSSFSLPFATRPQRRSL